MSHWHNEIKILTEASICICSTPARLAPNLMGSLWSSFKLPVRVASVFVGSFGTPFMVFFWDLPEKDLIWIKEKEKSAF